MNIENIFPEISCFIKEPKQYELLYYKDDIIHNEYALDVEEAERIMNCLNKLQQENQQLKEEIKKLKTDKLVLLGDCKVKDKIIKKLLD